MNKLIWTIIILFAAGNSFFVLPFHYSSDTITSNSILHYKKDPELLKAVFLDSLIPLKLQMPRLYEAFYTKTTSPALPGDNPFLLVNVSLLDNLDFFSLIFPFYKTINVKGEITFLSTIKVDGQPDRDSIALIGNITSQMRVTVKGICTPQHVSKLVEKEFAKILGREMERVETNINWRPPVDLIPVSKVEKPASVRKRLKAGKKI